MLSGLGQNENRIHKADPHRISQVRKQKQELNIISIYLFVRYTGVTVDTNFTNISKLPSKSCNNKLSVSSHKHEGYAKFGKMVDDSNTVDGIVQEETIECTFVLV